jgi:hypothetical protein
MQVHIYRGSGRVFGFTLNGAGLPAQFGPWIQGSRSKQGDAQTNFDVNDCLDDIEQFGFHLTDAHVRITHDVKI